MIASPGNRGHPISPPIAWVGGKRSILPEIVSRFPARYSRYVEVFGGSGVVLFGKKPTPFEVWNDYNGDLYNFFYCVKHKHIAFLRELGFLPLNSRQEFGLMLSFMQGQEFAQQDMREELALAHKHFEEPDIKQIKAILTERCMLGDVSRAVAFFKVNRMSYGSGMDSFNCRPINLRKAYTLIWDAYHRLAGTVILENKDFQDLIKHYDREDTFFYLDPPYYMAEKLYAVAFPRADHQRLFDVLTHKDRKGKWLLSYNDEPFIRELYAGYYQYDFTRHHSLAARYRDGAEYNEILIANYDMNQNRQMSLFQ